MSIEDDIFLNILEVQGIKRTKSMYEKARYIHTCSMCLDESEQEVPYKLKLEYINDFNIPYIFICKDCYESLPEE